MLSQLLAGIEVACAVRCQRSGGADGHADAHPSGLDRRDEGLHAEDVHGPREIVGEHEVITASGYSVLTLSAAMSASSASTAMWSVFPFNLSPTVNCTRTPPLPITLGQTFLPCVAKGREPVLLRCECCQRLQRGRRTNRKGRKIKFGVVAVCKWPGNLSPMGNPDDAPAPRPDEWPALQGRRACPVVDPDGVETGMF